MPLIDYAAYDGWKDVSKDMARNKKFNPMK